MKRLITIMAGISFITSASLSAAACGVTNGSQVDVKIVNEPEKVDDKGSKSPITDYVYNDQYVYSSTVAKVAITQASQLLFDRLYLQKNQFTGPVWTQYFNSDANQSGNISSFSYDLKKDEPSLPVAINDFTYKAKDNNDLVYVIKDNDASNDANRTRAYWFTTSPTPYEPGNDYKASPDTIVIPKISDFTKDKTEITLNGWIHLYINVGKFIIDFSAQLDFDFVKYTDNNGFEIVLLDDKTFSNPFGNINFDNPVDSFKRLSQISIKLSS